MEKASGSTTMVSLKIVKELEIAPNNILLSLIFHISDRLLYFDIFR